MLQVENDQYHSELPNYRPTTQQFMYVTLGMGKGWIDKK